MAIDVGIIMGSQSDWATMKEAATILDDLGIRYETKIVSAHRTPDRLWTYGKTAAERGLAVFGFSEHSPRPLGYDYPSEYREHLSAAFPGYLRAVRALRQGLQELRETLADQTSAGGRGGDEVPPHYQHYT